MSVANESRHGCSPTQTGGIQMSNGSIAKQKSAAVAWVFPILLSPLTSPAQSVVTITHDTCEIMVPSASNLWGLNFNLGPSAVRALVDLGYRPAMVEAIPGDLRPQEIFLAWRFRAQDERDWRGREYTRHFINFEIRQQGSRGRVVVGAAHGNGVPSTDNQAYARVIRDLPRCVIGTR